jgi:hypothetical protein
MGVTRDECRIEELEQGHGVNVGLFAPFVIERLRDNAGALEATLTVHLRNVRNANQSVRALRICWDNYANPPLPLAVSEQTVTEWAAVGVAALVISRYAALRIEAVTMRGDRFDYWIGDGERRYGMEISGTSASELDVRHAAKVRQLLDNPYGADGFVVVVGFAARQVICSFHRFREDV